jgi:hypothetical protein
MDDGWLLNLATKPAGLFRALHTFDFPPLASRPWLRTSLIVGLCLCGLAFSLTDVVLAWRRLGLGAPAGLGQKADGPRSHPGTERSA